MVTICDPICNAAAGLRSHYETTELLTFSVGNNPRRRLLRYVDKHKNQELESSQLQQHQ